MQYRITDAYGVRHPATAVDEPAQPTPGRATEVIAQRVVEMLTRIANLDHGRILLVDPRSDTLFACIRELGCMGDVTILRSAPRSTNMPDMNMPEMSPRESAVTRAAAREVSFDWRGAAASNHLDAPVPITGETFEIIVVCDDSASLQGDDRVQRVLWLLGFLAPRGFLVLDERLERLGGHVGGAERQAAWEQLSTAGLLPVTDEALVRDDNDEQEDEQREGMSRSQREGSQREGSQREGSRIVVAAQFRGAGECRQSHVLRRVLLADLDGDPMLQASLVTAYRNIFGGEEWQEWMRCTEPSCGRRYSHAATAALARPEWCECGASLEPFHPPALVAAMLRSDLAGGEVSRCYVRSGPDGSVDGFIWGYITTPEQLAGVLVEPEYARAQERLVAHLQQLVHSAGAPDKRIYYQSQIGVAEGMRSLSALRALFHRALQFASDNGVGVVVTRTHPHAPVYSLLKGLDLQIVHRYDDLMDQEGDGKQVLAQQVLAPGDTSDHRVVFGGNLQPIVTLTLAESDRRIALHLAHRLREIRENAITEAARAAKHAAE